MLLGCCLAAVLASLSVIQTQWQEVIKVGNQLPYGAFMAGVFAIVLSILNHRYASLWILATCCVPVETSLRPAFVSGITLCPPPWSAIDLSCRWIRVDSLMLDTLNTQRHCFIYLCVLCDK